MLWIGLGFLIGMFARTLGGALVLTGVAVGLTLLTLNVGFYLGVDFLVIGGPEPAAWDWETMGLIFATDLPLALLAAWRHVPRADAGEAPRCPGHVIMETFTGF